MAGNDMELLLLGGSDSSDDDDGFEEVTTGTAVPAAAAVAASVQPAPGPPAPVPAAQSELSSRLKSLYSPASKAQQQQQPQQQQQQQPPPQQQQQQQQQLQQQPPKNSTQVSQQHRQAPTMSYPTPTPAPTPQMPHLQPAASSSRISSSVHHQTPNPVAPSNPQTQPTPHHTSPRVQPIPHHQQPQQTSAATRHTSVGSHATNAQQRSTSSTHHHSTSSSAPRDPFEPTPLTTMIQRHQSKGSYQGMVPGQSVPQSSQTTPNPIPTQSSGIKPQTSMSSTTMPMPMPSHSQQRHNISATASIGSTSSGTSIASNATVRTSNLMNPMASSTSSSSATRAQMEREAKQRKERFLMFARVLMKYLEQKDPGMHAKAKAVIRECTEKNKRKEAGYESVTASMQTRLRDTVGDAYWKRAESYLSHFLKQKSDLEKRKTRPQQGSQPPQQSQPIAQQSQQMAQQQAHHQQQQAIQQQKLQAQKAQHAALQRQQQAQQHAAQQKAAQHAAQQKAAQQAAQHAAQQKAAQQAAQQKAAQQAAQQQAAQHAAQQQKERELARQREEQAQAQARAIKKKQEEMMRKKQQQDVQKAKHAAAKLAQINRDNSAQTPKITPSLPSPAQRTTSSSISSTVSTDKKQRPRIEKRKSASELIIPDQPPREYSQLMEELDHSISYDWTTAGMLLQNKSDVHLGEEQRKLLYGQSRPKPPDQTRYHRRGWSQRNVVSSRIAWARIRLKEQDRELKEARSSAPTVAGLTLPSAESQSKPTITWFNEDKAEEDFALELLSEATEIYLKQILDRALQCARQRQNLAGIRLWHVQHSQSKPPLSLRLGCDVKRQVALAAGNAARTSQRMEEALDRNVLPASKRDLKDPKTLYNASSMGELALLPLLASGAEEAEYFAKRSFEVSGGKDSGEPPFGRVPKRAKIMTVDFDLGMEFINFACQRKGIATTNFE